MIDDVAGDGTMTNLIRKKLLGLKYSTKVGKKREREKRKRKWPASPRRRSPEDGCGESVWEKKVERRGCCKGGEAEECQGAHASGFQRAIDV